MVQLVFASAWLFPRRPQIAAVAMAGAVALFSLNWTTTVMFGPYDDYYQNSWSPQREAGLFMRGFAESDGAWGNVFVLAAAHFFDYRGLAIDAGLAPGEYQNVAISSGRTAAAAFMTDCSAATNSALIRALYSGDNTAEDENALQMLESWFPEGRDMVIDTRVDEPWLVNEPYKAFRIPPLGREGLRDFLISQEFTFPGE